MAMDLALYLRLSRTLDMASGNRGLELGSEPVLAVLDSFLLALGEHGDSVRGVDGSTETPVQVQEAELDSVQSGSSPEILAFEESGANLWTHDFDLLYEDVMWLFRIGDIEGALGSVGRLLEVAADTEELKQFIEINEPKLLLAYEKSLGAFNQPVKVALGGLGDRYFWNLDDAEVVLQLTREKGNIEGVVASSPLHRLVTLAILFRLRSERLITTSLPVQSARAGSVA